MKKQAGICLAVASLISCNCFAIEIYKGKITQHKEWSTGNVKAIYKSGPIKNEIKAKLRGDTNLVRVDSGTSPIKGIVGQVTPIEGSHYAYIINQTATTQQYNYTFGMCAEIDPHLAQCAYYYDEFELEPGGYVFAAEHPVLELTLNQAGQYKQFAQSSIQNVNNETQLNSSSISENIIDIN